MSVSKPTESETSSSLASGFSAKRDMPVIVLRSKSDRRIRQGHCWIYSNEIDIERSGFKSMAIGQVGTLVSASGVMLGSAYFNPHTLLCGRLFSRQADQALDYEFISNRLNRALIWRSSCYVKPFYRLVYGDGDSLPGLVVDRYGDILVVQVTTAGMMAVLDTAIKALVDVVAPKGILLRNEAANEPEKLPAHSEVLYGDVPEYVDIEENNTVFSVPVFSGQKTGWFFDHRESRALLAKYAKGKRVLDVYSYLGAWGLEALNAGAASLCCIDSSEPALKLAAAAAARGGFENQFTSVKSSAVDGLKALVKQGESFDVVILDPPAFIKRRKDQRSGEKAYHHINQLAAKLLGDQGLLVSASCSLHLPRQGLIKIVQTAAYKAGRTASIVYQGGLGADHPVNAAMPEMDYLKAVFARLD